MKPAPFEYHAPVEIDEVLSLLAEHGDEAKPLAGGQSLVPMLNLRLTRFEHLVDLNRVPALAGVRAANGHVEVGAMTRQAAALADDTLAQGVPLLTEALAWVGHFQTRNRGTIGGSLSHADPTAEIPAVALALDAEVDVASAGGGTRTISVDDILDGAWTTTLEPEDLVTAVRFARTDPQSGSALREVARRHGDFAVAGAVARVVLGADGSIAQARVVTFAVEERARRSARAEEALVGLAPAAVDAAAVGRLAGEGVDPLDDVQGTATYRRSAVSALVEDVVQTALARAQGGGGDA